HGAVRVTFPTSAVDARVRRNWLTLGAIGGLTLAAAAVAGLALGRWASRPLRDLERATTALGRGDLAARSPVGAGPPEVRRLAAAVNETADRLQELMGAQEAFVADASHQLRTPLTSLRLRLELLEQALAGGGQSTEATGVAASLREVARLSRLVDGLLALARVERSASSATAEVVDLRSALEDRAEAWSAVAADEDASIVVEADLVRARATPDRLAQVLDNLIANAVEASPAGGVVVLRAFLGPGGVELHVADQGPGLPEEAREHAFDRFWSGREGGGRLGGSGLGLAIVRKLVEADGGTVELRARPAGGIDATVVLAPAVG
ncbi:MAG: HAMP domain-containing sensor histidine kinase, partial [Acidimicrobiales bacterium]|nr:HAMP domain-containing sensor histidine kinase [Acidimicrobiales bacterium]